MPFFALSTAKRFLSLLPLQKRLQLGLKCAALIVCAGFAMSGHPPSAAQTSTTWQMQAMSSEDTRQDTDISYIKSELSTRSSEQAAQQLILIKQGEDLARLDTKMTMFVSLLGFLQTGGILLSLAPLKGKFKTSEG